MRIALAQLDPIVGAFELNLNKITAAFERACADGARVLVTPELGICGYPPHDLVERPELFERCEESLKRLCEITRGKSCALVVGSVGRNPQPSGKSALNRVNVIENGKIVFEQVKTLLPTYDIFDESRYFEPSQDIQLWDCDGLPVALAICEDLWAEDPALKRPIYRQNPVEVYQKLGAKLLISISSSPYEWGKRERRESLHFAIAARLGVPLIYVNQVGANDEILFDGASFACDGTGRMLGRLPVFATGYGVIDPLNCGGNWPVLVPSEREDQPPHELETLSRALLRGIEDYFLRTGFDSAVLGLSGGIDSAVVATLAARALGSNKVRGIAMPSQYSSGYSLEDAERLARNLGILFEFRPIKFLFSTAVRELGEGTGGLAAVAQENLQSRLRGMILMTLSNHYGSLVLTTGNKSEIAMGYCTLYGDMCGALAPIGDLYKTRVYALARYMNQEWGQLIPERILTKAPSAELRPNQMDQDTLPPYDALDAVLEGFLEGKRSVSELEQDFLKLHSPESWIRDVLKTVDRCEYKRRQSAPALKVSSKAFGIGRRIPIAKNWDL